jgi:hypothetical protein
MNFDHALDENNLSTNSAGESVSPIEAAARSAPEEEAAAPTEATAPSKEAIADPAPVKPEEKIVAPAARKAESAAAETKAIPDAGSAAERQNSSLIPFIPPQRADAPPPSGNEFMRAAFEKRFQLGAVAAGVALVGVLATVSISYKTQQEQYLVSQSQETESLAETVKSLKAKIAGLESARQNEIVDLRKMVADVRNGLANARDAGSATSQLSARFDRTEHDQDARIEKLGERIDHDASAHYADITSRIEKLAERVDHDAATRNADFAARLEKLEKKVATPVVASLAPAQPAPIAGLAKQPTPPPLPPVAPGVSNAPGVSRETTGSIPAAPRPPIRNWVVREVHGGVAVVEGPYGYREIGPGDMLPGAGRVERIERRGRDWAVVTNQGTISGPGGMGPGGGGMNGMADGDF